MVSVSLESVYLINMYTISACPGVRFYFFSEIGNWYLTVLYEFLHTDMFSISKQSCILSTFSNGRDNVKV